MSFAAPAVEVLDCVVTPEWAVTLTGACNTGHLQEALAVPALWLEVQLLEKLLYKNANQHRGAQHYQRLQEVRRLLSLLRSQQLHIHVAALQDALAAAQKRGALPTGSVLMAHGGDQRRVPSHQAAAHVLRTLCAACQLVEQLAPAVQRASLQLLAQLAHSFFMPLCLTSLAVLARIQVLAGQLLSDLVRAYNALAEVAPLLPPSPPAHGQAAAADGAAPAGSAGSGRQPEQEALPQLLRALWSQGLPRVDRVPCQPGESLPEQAAAACQRYSLHIVPREAAAAAATASAVVLVERATQVQAPAGLQRMGAYRGRAAAAAAAPVLAVVEDRGVPISREAFAAAAATAAVADAGPACTASEAPVAEVPLLGVVEDSVPEEDAGGTVASLMEGEARGHLYRRAALGLGAPAQRAQRQSGDAPAGTASASPAVAKPDGAAAAEAAAAMVADGPLPTQQPAAAAAPAVAAASAPLAHDAAAPAAAARRPAPAKRAPPAAALAAAAAVKPAFLSVASTRAAAPKPAFLSVGSPAKAATRPSCAAPTLPARAAGHATAGTTQQTPAGTPAAAAAAPQQAVLPLLATSNRKRKKAAATGAAGAAELPAQQQQQQQGAAPGEPKSWEDWLQPLGAGPGGTPAPAQKQQGGAQDPKQQQQQSGKRQRGR